MVSGPNWVCSWNCSYFDTKSAYIRDGEYLSCFGVKVCYFIMFLKWVDWLDLMCTTGDALNALKTQLGDPNNVLQSWDATLVNPCTWFHVTCNNENSVTRV